MTLEDLVLRTFTSALVVLIVLSLAEAFLGSRSK